MEVCGQGHEDLVLGLGKSYLSEMRFGAQNLAL